jgi:hypothetical protein
MTMATGSDGSRPAAEHLREQIAEHRRELAETVTALRDKTDVKGRVREKAAGAEIAAADLAGWAGRTAGSVPRMARWAASTASDQVHKVPQPVRTPLEQAAALVGRRLRTLLAVATVAMAILAIRRRFVR